MVDEPSTLKIELIYWPATTFAARAEAQAALFRYIDGWQKPGRIPQGLVGRSPDEYEAQWQARQASTRSATLQRKGAEKPR
jgi:putative transposase